MAKIELRQVEKKFGDLHAVKPVDLVIDEGEFIVLLGPSGCGKTTTLRMVSGLEAVTSGNILLNGRDVTWAHPSERDIAFVFQFYALYPHLSVWHNIAFPLQAQGEKREVIDQRVKEVVRLLRIENLLNKRPGKLSGGDQQRVALARALVRRPAAFLMDEPLGALDAEFRESMRAEIKRLHLSLNATTMYVTHDQVEAMAMGDRIVVMSQAVIQQVGTPAEVYYNPANLFVARFIGSPGMNLLKGAYHEGQVALQDSPDRFPVPVAWRSALDIALMGKEAVTIGFRPESAYISETGALSGRIYASEMTGAYNILHIDVNENEIVHLRTDRSIDYSIGTQVRFDVDQAMVRFFNPESESAIQMEVLQ